MSNVEVIEIRITGDARGGKKALQETNKELGGFKKTVAGVNDVLNVAGGLAAGFAVVMQGYKFGRAGAELEYAEIKFDRLATAIGTTGDALREDLADATDGLLSDADQMQLAGDLMSLGLVKTHDHAVRLARVVSELDMNMNQLTLTLANQTTMRFDTLSVSTDGFKERLQELRDAGLSVEDAFSEAFLQQAEEQIETVGSVSETNLGKIKRFEASMENLGNTVKTKLAPPLATAADGLALLFTWGEKMNELFEEAEDRIILTSNSYGQYTDRILEALVVTGQLSEAEAEVVAGYIEHGEYAMYLYEKYGILTDEMYANEHIQAILAEQTAETTEEVQELAWANMDLATALEEANTGLGNRISKLQDEIFWIENGGLALQAWVDQIESDYKNGLLTAEEAVDELNAAQIQQIALTAEMDGMTLEEIVKEFEDLGYSEWQALSLASGVYNQINMINGLTASADIFINVHGSIPRLPGAGEYSWDTSGQMEQLGWGGQQYQGQGPPQALGGSVKKGRSYWVGEFGPEPFVPMEDGYIVSNRDAREPFSPSGGGGASININLYYQPAVSFATPQEFEDQLFPLIDRAVREIERLSP